MFSNFKSKADIRGTTPVKSSAQKNMKLKLVEAYPGLANYIDEIIPKKSQLTLSKCEDRMSLYSVDGKVVFFQSFDDDMLPSLRIVHLYPDAFTTVRVDKGAIKFVLSGANIMAPGMTSAGGMLPEELDVGKVVVVTAEGKEHAVAVGITKMTAADMRSQNKGHGVATAHYLGDWLWKLEAGIVES